MAEAPDAVDRALERMRLPFDLESPRNYTDVVAVDMGTVNYSLTVQRTFGVPPEPQEFIDTVIRGQCDGQLDRALALRKSPAWSARDNTFFELFGTFHVNLTTGEVDQKVVPELKALSERTWEQVIEPAMARGLQGLVEYEVAREQDAALQRSTTVLPIREAESAEIVATSLYPRAAMVHAVVRDHETVHRKTCRNLVQFLLSKEMAWLFASQIGVVTENQQDQIARNRRHRPPIMWTIQLLTESIIRTIDLMLGFDRARTFTYVTCKWGIREAVAARYPEDYSSTSLVPENDDEEMDTTRYTHRKNAMAWFMFFVLALHPSGEEWIGYLRAKETKVDEETDCMAMALRHCEVNYKSTPPTQVELATNIERSYTARRLVTDGLRIAPTIAQPLPPIQGKASDFQKRRPRKKRARESDDEDYDADEAVEEEIKPVDWKTKAVQLGVVVRRKATKLARDDEKRQRQALQKRRRASPPPDDGGGGGGDDDDIYRILDEAV